MFLMGTVVCAFTTNISWQEEEGAPACHPKTGPYDLGGYMAYIAVFHVFMLLSCLYELEAEAQRERERIAEVSWVL